MWVAAWVLELTWKLDGDGKAVSYLLHTSSLNFCLCFVFSKFGFSFQVFKILTTFEGKLKF